MFCIWSYLEFPSCLSFSSVHSSWKTRLWPIELKEKKVKTNRRKRINRTSNISKGITNQQKKKRSCDIRDQVDNFIPLKSSVSITSSNALYSNQVKSAVFRNLPGKELQCALTLSYLFSIYNKINTIEIVLEDKKFTKVGTNLLLECCNRHQKQNKSFQSLILSCELMEKHFLDKSKIHLNANTMLLRINNSHYSLPFKNIQYVKHLIIEMDNEKYSLRNIHCILNILINKCNLANHLQTLEFRPLNEQNQKKISLKIFEGDIMPYYEQESNYAYYINYSYYGILFPNLEKLVFGMINRKKKFLGRVSIRNCFPKLKEFHYVKDELELCPQTLDQFKSRGVILHEIIN